MGLFGNSSPFDDDVEKITHEQNTAEDWGQIMNMCDKVAATRSGTKDCLRSIVKRLNHNDPHVVMQAIVLLDACVNNCGKSFKLEVASREFEQDFRKLLSRSHPKVQEKLKSMLKKWADGEFKGDSQFALIPSLYHSLRREGVDFSSSEAGKKQQALPKDPNVVSSQQEEEDIAKAIQASLQDTGSNAHHGTRSKGKSAKSTSGGLYPTADLAGGGGGGGGWAGAGAGAGGGATEAGNASEPKKARALYDFEAAEDNELTFKAGEIVIILDSSDANWWKGSNHRGEGLFPANFVSTDFKEAEETQKRSERRRSVQFNEEVEVKTLKDDEIEAAAAAGALGPVEISEDRIDRVLTLLNDSDPTTDENDDPELNVLEDHVNRMGPMIDNELEKVDRRLAQLTKLSTELVDAMNLYHQLMRELPAQPYQMPGAPYNMGMAPPQQAYMSPPYAPVPPGAPQQQQPMYAPMSTAAPYQPMPPTSGAPAPMPQQQMNGQQPPATDGGMAQPPQYMWPNGSGVSMQQMPPQQQQQQPIYAMANGGAPAQPPQQNGYPSPMTQAPVPQQQQPMPPATATMDPAAAAPPPPAAPMNA